MAYKINLLHRGPQVIECIDLFDEARYGADKLFFRGRFNTANEVASQVKASLTKMEFKDEDGKVIDMGNGNPLTKETSETEITVPTIALNRYHIPNKKFWNNVVPTDVQDPYKASAAVRFSIRVHFNNDFAYIDFGCPWCFTDEYGNGSLDEGSSADEFISKFVILGCHFISKEDALNILTSIFGDSITTASTEYSFMRNAPQVIVETTELIDEDGSIIAL